MLKGIDASFWQDIMDFKKAKSHGISFAFLRAQFGNSFDTRFRTNWILARDAGIFRGAYFFPIKSLSVIEQTDRFLSVLKGLDFDIPPVIDVEEYNNSTLSASDVLFIINSIKKEFGVSPIIYTSNSMWKKVAGGDRTSFADYPLWLAAWDAPVDTLETPKPWTSWSFWQSQVISNGCYYGTSPYNTIDLNYFRGGEKELLSLSNKKA